MRLRVALVILLLTAFSMRTVVIARQSVAAIVEITFSGVELQRANTGMWLPLSAGAQAPFGVGDILRTDKRGRARITFGEAAETLLMPGSEYRLDAFDQNDAGRLDISGRLLSGRSIQNVTDAGLLANYQLNLEHMALTKPTLLFAAQVQPNIASDVIVAQGSLEVSRNITSLTLNAGSGLRATDTLGDVISITAPQGFSFLSVTAATCRAIVNATIPGATSVTVRLGPGEDYFNLGNIPNGTQVAIVGKMENGTRYLTPFLSSFGWMIANGIILQSCDNIPIVPAVAQPIDGVVNANTFEMDLLAPFFGTPSQNIRFYTYE